METEVTIPFADGEYRFWLPLPQVFELERSCGNISLLDIEERLRAGVGQDGETFHFLGGGKAMAKEIREVVRLGLIGGNSGMVDGEEVEVGPSMAKHLVDNYVYPARPMGESVVLAWRILHAAIYGVQLKKKATEAESPNP